ncbi:hypothetical protein BBB_1457 [Bifidobacterium bifidum BGN4]|uniref:Uncharacterized protein n=3 Tax=Bifidobacterium bifidum TaxID=1681 RepID=I3WJI5_BIFBI|nr:hypothetical protein BBB_1457 [Bifidobacterium bifidum BGN4]ALE11950.1 Hypothetical protein RY70_1619 [Bifidobacterium bifidum]KWZ81340.1 hypothetical protein HMPREF3196_01083 [Bifidobacterium bifidum]BBA47499.1 hypothetical protein BBJK_00681 [Bifidobacterium bifidum LMG 13195]
MTAGRVASYSPDCAAASRGGYRSPDYSGALTAGFAGIPAYSIGTCIGTFEEE